MDNYPDFPPEPRRRASDPSLEEMLRRARDAPLDDGRETPDKHAPRLTPLPSRPQLWRQGAALPARIVFWIGVMVGALVMYLVFQAQPFAGSAAPQPPAVQYAAATATAMPPTPTDTPLPAPTDTPAPTPTDVPTATPVSPPTTDEIVALAQDFYDNQSPAAGCRAARPAAHGGDPVATRRRAAISRIRDARSCVRGLYPGDLRSCPGRHAQARAGRDGAPVWGCFSLNWGQNWGQTHKSGPRDIARTRLFSGQVGQESNLQPAVLESQSSDGTPHEELN